MLEPQTKITKPELYEKLIDRLGLALDAVKTAGRLRDEWPLELELRGLSRAEFELIQAYLDRNDREAQGSVLAAVKQKDAPRSAQIIWLKDKAPGRGAVKVRSLLVK